MSKIMLKISSGDACFRLEGEESPVYQLFQEIKNDVMQALFPADGKADSSESLVTVTSNPPEQLVAEERVQEDPPYPSLDEVRQKELPSSEPEWILVCAFYCSDYGHKPVSRQEIRELYKQCRLTASRSGNFSANLSSLQENHFLFEKSPDLFSVTEAGKERVSNILEGKIVVKKPRKKTGSASSSYQLVPLGLDSAQRKLMESFYYQYKPNSNKERILLLFYWINKNAFIDVIDSDTAFTLLRAVKESTSFNIRQSLRDMQSRNHYTIPTNKRGKYRISNIGEDHVTLKLMKNKGI